MTNPQQSSSTSEVDAIYRLLASYSFDPEAYPTEVMISGWLNQFGPIWVSHAITEALYQGRYKLISIDQILKLWQRRGQPLRHFNREFETIILGQTLLVPAASTDRPGAAASPKPRAKLVKAPLPKIDGAGQEPSTAATASAAQTHEVAAPDSEDDGQGADSGGDGQRPAKGHCPDPNTEGTAEVVAPASSTAVFDPEPAIPNFRPLVSELSTAWGQADAIQPFVPRHDQSDLHQRLRAVVQAGMAE